MYLLSYNSFFNLNKDGCSFLWNLQWIANPEVPIYWCSIAGECHIPQYRTSHPEAHCHPKVNLKSFTKLKENILLESLLDNLEEYRPATLLKRDFDRVIFLWILQKLSFLLIEHLGVTALYVRLLFISIKFPPWCVTYYKTEIYLVLRSSRSIIKRLLQVK